MNFLVLRVTKDKKFMLVTLAQRRRWKKIKYKKVVEKLWREKQKKIRKKKSYREKNRKENKKEAVDVS